MRETNKDCCFVRLMTGEEIKPAWRAYAAIARVRVLVFIPLNFYLISSVAFSTVFPIVPIFLLVNVALSISQLITVRCAVNNRIKKFTRLENYLLANPSENSRHQYWTASEANRLQNLFVAFSALLILASFSLCFFQLPIAVSFGLICFLLVLFSMKPSVYSAVADGFIDWGKVFSSVLKRIPSALCLLLPAIMMPFFSMPTLVGVGLLLPTIIVSAVALRREKLVFLPLIFCVVGFSLQFATVPVATLLVGLLAINIFTCFTIDSLMCGLHAGVKENVLKKYNVSFWKHDNCREQGSSHPADLPIEFVGASASSS